MRQTLKPGDTLEVKGDSPTMTVHEHALGEWANQMRAQQAVIAQDVALKHDNDRQATEDTRANRRNRNRFLTLLVAVIMTFVVPYVVANIIQQPAILKYATGIAIFPDALITAYAYWKKY